MKKDNECISVQEFVDMYGYDLDVIMELTKEIHDILCGNK